MLLHGRELETSAGLVTPTVKRALANAEQHFHDTNCTMPDFLALAVANELHPAPQMQHWIKHTQQILFGDKNR
jgi:hypothetical protein